MTQILAGIWQNAPVWVWPLFFVLLFIGFMAMRPRNSSIIPYFFYPLFGLTAANAIASLVHEPTNWIAFSIAFLAGAALAFRWQDGLVLEKSGWTVRLRGERITIVILMVIFFSNFVNGVITAVAPDLRSTVVFTLVFASIVGACSGSFTGRAVRVVSLKNRSASGV